MALSTQDKIGVAILIALFSVLAGLMVWLAPPKPDKTFKPEDSPIVQRRMEILQQREGR